MFENNFIYSKNVPNAPVFQFCSKEKNKNNKIKNPIRIGNKTIRKTPQIYTNSCLTPIENITSLNSYNLW